MEEWYLEEATATANEESISREDCLGAIMFKEVTHRMVYLNLKISLFPYKGGTSDFNPSDIERFLILDKVGCHGTILPSIHRQLGEILQLLY